MKAQGIGLIDCSSGGIPMVKVNSYPNYQVSVAELIRREVGIMTGPLGLIETGHQAEETLRNGRTDFVLVGREMLKDPFWARNATGELRLAMPVPPSTPATASRGSAAVCTSCVSFRRRLPEAT